MYDSSTSGACTSGTSREGQDFVRGRDCYATVAETATRDGAQEVRIDCVVREVRSYVVFFGFDGIVTEDLIFEETMRFVVDVDDVRAGGVEEAATKDISQRAEHASVDGRVAIYDDVSVFEASVSIVHEDGTRLIYASVETVIQIIFVVGGFDDGVVHVVSIEDYPTFGVGIYRFQFGEVDGESSRVDVSFARTSIRIGFVVNRVFDRCYDFFDEFFVFFFVLD